MYNEKFTLIIPTKNRIKDLTITLNKLEKIITNFNLRCIICDDGSSDGTFETIIENYPNVDILKNVISKGIHYTRNRLLNKVKTPFSISIDDDANLLTFDFFNDIEEYFNGNPSVGILCFRAFWNVEEPKLINTNDFPLRVKSFGAVCFAIRMDAWNEIPNFPNWFIFYGEEDFVSFQLFKKGWEVHYFPKVLVHHRVNLKERKNQKDYTSRLRRSLRAGWYLYLLFYPLKIVTNKILYSIWMQFKLKVFKGDFRALGAIIMAVWDLLINLPRLFYSANRLSKKEFEEHLKLVNPKIYWVEEESKK